MTAGVAEPRSRIARFRLHAWGWMVVVLVLGCSGASKEVLQEAKNTETEFKIGPEDVLEVVVWRNPDLSRQVVVRPDGVVSLPVIGDIAASGLVADELADRIQKRLTDYMATPTVSVAVKDVNSYSVYVMGEVTKPGKFQLKSYATVLQVIALAGGFTQYASKNSIQVIRNSVNGNGTAEEIHIPVKYDDLISGESDVGNFVLKSGDIVVVP